MLSALLCAATHLRYPQVTLLEEKVEGVALVHIDAVQPYSSPFQRFLLYKGTLKRFQSNAGSLYTNVPCRIYLPWGVKREPATTDYTIHGHLTQKGPYDFSFKPKKGISWEAVPSLKNCAEWRYTLKQTLFSYLDRHIPDAKAKTLLHALICGEMDDRMLRMDFGKLGLQHILAISGFHFSLLALFLTALLKLVFPKRLLLIILLLSLTAYAFFLGFSAPIFRASIAISLAVIGQLIHRHSLGLNALGVGLILATLFAPLCILELGFQMSYVCTFAILLFYPVVERTLERILPKRTYSEALLLKPLDAWGYLATTLLRSSLALNLAVHLISLPVLLHLFYRFPLLSLAYNLFFPAALSLSLGLLLFSLLLHPVIPPLACALHALNTQWTGALLNLTSHPPAFLDFSLRCKVLSLESVVLFLGLALFFGIWRQSLEKKP